MSGIRTIAQEVKEKEHVFILLTHENVDRPVISLDIHETNGDRSLLVRCDGTTVASILIDQLGPTTAGKVPSHRYCPYCGKEIIILSSSVHTCKEDDER